MFTQVKTNNVYTTPSAASSRGSEAKPMAELNANRKLIDGTSHPSQSDGRVDYHRRGVDQIKEVKRYVKAALAPGGGRDA